VSEGRTPVPSEERYRTEFLDAHDRLVGAGYVHYEVSNFARPGFESRHNRAYWNRSPYVGLGNGAHSWAAGRRWWNHRSWNRYRDAVAHGQSAVEGDERPTGEQAELERLWLGLRTSDGLPLPAAGSPARGLVERWQGGGLAGAEGGRLTLTAPGWLLLDELVVELDVALSSDRIGSDER
jgi:oxygen-independent coproporphyrinogen-3 oxidase